MERGILLLMAGTRRRDKRECPPSPFLAGKKFATPPAQGLRSFKQAPKARHKRPDAP